MSAAKAVQTALALGLSVLAVAVPARAQSSSNRPSLRESHVVVSAGTSWAGSYPIGNSLAELRSNAPGSQPPPFTLFAASANVESLANVEGGVGFALSRSLVVEAHGSFARPNIAVAISQDQESTRQSLDGEKLHQVVVTGGVVWQLPYSMGTRMAPFVTTGVGYLRQLHEERTLVETGRVFYVGAGARYFITGGDGIGRSIGLRGDVRATWRSPGIDFENKTRLFPAASVSFFIGF